MKCHHILDGNQGHYNRSAMLPCRLKTNYIVHAFESDTLLKWTTLALAYGEVEVVATILFLFRRLTTTTDTTAPRSNIHALCAGFLI